MTDLPDPVPKTASTTQSTPPEPRRFKCFLLVSTWVMVGLMAANLLLFRAHGFDLPFVLVGAAAAWCFLWARVRKVPAFFEVVSLFIALPGWFLALALVYYTVLGTYAYLTAKSVPDSLVRVVSKPEDLAAYEEVKRRFLADPPLDAAKKVEETLKEISKSANNPPKYGPFERDRWKTRKAEVRVTWEKALADPVFTTALEKLRPYLDEYQEFYLTHRPEHANLTSAESYPDLTLRQRNMDLELAIIRHLAGSPDGAAEAQTRYERLLRTSLVQLEGNLVSVGLLVEITIVARALKFLESAPPAFYSPESAARQAELLEELRPRVKSGFQTMLCAELKMFMWLSEMRADLTRFVDPGDPPKPAFLSMGAGRITYFPFNVPKFGVDRVARSLEVLAQAFDLPILEADRRINASFDVRSPLEIMLGPAPYSVVMARIFSPVFGSVWRKCELLNSRLAAHEYALRLRIAQAGGASVAAPVDPMGEKPFHLIETPRFLVIAGGHPNIGNLQKLEEERLRKYGLTSRYQYIIEMPKPIGAPP